MTTKKFIIRDGRSGRLTISRAAMTKLNAMEGVRQTASSRSMFAEFDSKGLPNDQRRSQIVLKHSKKI